MPDRKVEPGVWGACTCGRWRYRLCDPGYVPEWGDHPGWERGGTGKVDGEYFVDGPDRGFYCSGSDCGDFCGEGGHVRPNARREAERMLAEALATHKKLHPSARHPLNTLSGNRIAMLRRLLATGCETCAGSGYVSEQNSSDDTWYQVPCPTCQPDGKGG